MGLLTRLRTLITSNLNAAIDRMSDPGREIEALIADMQDAVRAARNEVRASLASEKLARKEHERLVAEARAWEERAEQALRHGDEALAREALARKVRLDEEAAMAAKALAEQEAYVDELTRSLKDLETRVKEVELRKNTLKQQARMRSSHQGGSGGNAFAEFERISSKVDALEAESLLDEELSTTASRDAEVERKFRELGRERSVEDALADLKKKLDS